MTDSVNEDARGLPIELDFDPLSLRATYRSERNRRMRSDGLEQYRELTARDELVTDPFTPRADRDPLQFDTDVLIVGGGFAGLLSAVGLKKAGFDRFHLLDNAGDFGGTWYWNRYPGVRCDTEAYVYLPHLEDVDTVPTEKYVTGAEIFAHCGRLAQQFCLADHATFQTSVVSLDWDSTDQRWHVRTDRNDTITARYIVLGTGVMSRPKVPAIPGLEKFRGRVVHTSRWDAEYAGAQLENLQGKRVAVVGTGATSVQLIPALARAGAEVRVFQRTPSPVDIRANRPTDTGWFTSQPPGWQRERIDNFTKVVAGMDTERDLVADQWGDLNRRTQELRSRYPEKQLVEIAQLANFAKMQELRARTELVGDQDVASLLKPWYDYGRLQP